jgi:SOS-response transcriptional repressor LexA
MAPIRKISPTSVLRALNQLQIEGGKPPTIEELRVALGVGSTRTVLRYLQELEEAGDIERWSGARGIRLTRAPSAPGTMIDVPVVGAPGAASGRTASPLSTPGQRQFDGSSGRQRARDR